MERPLAREPARTNVTPVQSPQSNPNPSPPKGGSTVYTMDEVVNLINTLQGQNVLTRTGAASRSDEPENSQGFQ